MKDSQEHLPRPEELTGDELRYWIERTNEVIEDTRMLTIALIAADYLQELYDEQASRLRRRRKATCRYRVRGASS